MKKRLQFSVALIMSKAFSLSFTAGYASDVNHLQMVKSCNSTKDLDKAPCQFVIAYGFGLAERKFDLATL